jgi:hypothetical protein
VGSNSCLFFLYFFGLSSFIGWYFVVSDYLCFFILVFGARRSAVDLGTEPQFGRGSVFDF